MKNISILKVGSYIREANQNSKMRDTFTLRPIDIPPGEFVFVCCVCQGGYFTPQGCADGVWEGRGIYFDKDFYILVDPVDNLEEHKDCLDLLNLNPLGYLDNVSTYEIQ